MTTNISGAQFCSECDTAIRLERDESGTYLLRCACGKDVSIPKTWRYASWE